MPEERFSTRASVEPSSPQTRCLKCSKLIDPGSTFCPHCGQRQSAGDAWYYHPIWILVLAFVALGPFALILVWKSSKTSRNGKVLMAVAILAYTVLCLYYVYAAVSLELGHLSEYDGIMRQLNVR